MMPDLQRQEEEEELLQGKSLVQKQPEEEEEVQMTPDLQRQEEEEELLQGKSLVQRQEEEEELLQGKSLIQQQPEEEEELQAQPDASQILKVSDNIESRIDSARGSGQPLADSIHKPMEQAFKADFSDVRVHTDSEADALNQQLSARAFTTGKDVFFREGDYSPGSESGRKLIAHELTHVVQQGNGRIDSGMSMKTKGENQKSYGQKNDSMILIQRVTRTIPKPNPLDKRETVVEWEADGLLATIKAVTQNEGENKDRKAPKIFDEAYKETKTWKQGKISDVSAHGTDIYVYIKSPDKDIWHLSETAGEFVLKPISVTSKKRGKVKGRLKDFIKGTEDNTNKTAVANIIYDNMLKKLKYKVGGVKDWKQIIEGKDEGECTAIAGTMLHAVKTALMVNGVSSDDLTDVKTVTTGDNPFITRDGCDSAKSVIKGQWSNICTKKDGDNISVYDGKLQKFDNHEWLEVSGSVYDLVAGIKGGAKSCVGEDLTVIKEKEEYTCSKGTLKKQTAAEIRVSKPKSPWPTGYTLEPPHA